MRIAVLGKLFSHPNFTCDLCGREVFEKEHICADCKEHLPYNNVNFCICCGRRSLHEGYCIECRAHAPRYDFARSAFVYERDAKRMILRLKQGDKYFAETLADFLLPMLVDFPDAQLLAYVPMTEKAEKKRGFNQAKLLCEELSAWSGLPVFGGLSKVKESKMQKSLGICERQKNLKGCFKVTDRRGLKKKHVLLVDDTLTTGATASEIADLLKKAGAKRVYVLTAASVPDRRIDERR